MQIRLLAGTQRLSSVFRRCSLTPIFLVTMPDEGTGNWKEESHAKALHEIADYLKNCYVIDLYHEAPKYDEEFRSKYCGHMNAMGYLLTAHYFMTYIDWIIRHNVHDFVCPIYRKR